MIDLYNRAMAQFNRNAAGIETLNVKPETGFSP